MFKGITRKIIFSNFIGLPILFTVLTVFIYSRGSLTDLRLASMMEQAEMISAVLVSRPAGHYNIHDEKLRKGANGFFLRPPLIPSNMHARLFDIDGTLIEDSNSHPPGRIISYRLPDLTPNWDYEYQFKRIQHFFLTYFYQLKGRDPILFEENEGDKLHDFLEVRLASEGENKGITRINSYNQTVLSVAVPVRRLGKILGVLQLSVSGKEISDLIAQDRRDLIFLFTIATVMSLTISYILARNISEPVNQLAKAVRIFQSTGFRAKLSDDTDIPILCKRGDEIGDLSCTFLKMFDALRERIDGIENFAADVSHELKNPLTSLKSGIDTLERISDKDKRTKLLTIITQDIRRIDRLIDDISRVSRLDGEMNREVTIWVDIGKLIRNLCEYYQTAEIAPDITFICDVDNNKYMIEGIPDRLGQVFRNLVDNAISFTPKGGVIKIHAETSNTKIIITISDTGSGIPEESLVKIFERFYSHRPTAVKFGNHTGLGLSIVKQIVVAHNGVITAQNNRNAQGEITGACFMVVFPLTQK